MKIVIATCRTDPSLTESDLVFANALQRLGADVAAAPWNGDFAPFAEGDATIIRSTWDYYPYPREFAAWIDKVAAQGPLFNAPDLLRWSMGKLYLLELASMGIATPATRRVAPDAAAIASAMDALGLDEAIVKPVYGGTARGLTRVAREAPESLARAAVALDGEDGLTQAFIPEIETMGETSFIFIDGAFSHAVLKRAKAGDIRIQAEYGGTSQLIEPAQWMAEEAGAILKSCPGAPLYARIDAVVTARHLILMEVELVEPELFFTYCPLAAARLAGALLSKLK